MMADKEYLCEVAMDLAHGTHCETVAQATALLGRAGVALVVPGTAVAATQPQPLMFTPMTVREFRNRSRAWKIA